MVATVVMVVMVVWVEQATWLILFFFSYYGLCHNGGGGCVDRSSWLVDFLFLFFFSCHELWLP